MLTEEKDNLSKCSQNDLFVRRFMTLMPATTIRRWKLETEGSFWWSRKVFFGCYEPISKDYSKRNYKRRRICCVWKENHSTELHRYKPKCIESVPRGSQFNKEKSTDSGRKIACASTTIQEDVISMCVVPVKEKHKDSNFVYSTLAMLDNCSQGCFAKAYLLQKVWEPAVSWI